MNFTIFADCPRCAAAKAIRVDIISDPGVRTFSNGDPGYPPSDELDEAHGCPWCKATADNWTDTELDALTDAALSADARRIILTHVNPPIPVRDHDWHAVYEDDEQDGVARFNGWHATASGALQNLLDDADGEE